jgi:hypothetical protein
MGKTYKKIVKNKFEKKKLHILKQKQEFIEDYENEKDSLETVSEVQGENGADKDE